MLGAPRLLATIERGQVLSKTASGDFAAERWPEYTGLVRRCQRARAGHRETFTGRDGRAGLELLRSVVAAGTEAPRLGS